MKKYVESFIARVDREALPVQAVLAYRDDALLCAHHWAQDVPRNIYSHTKSFMSLAVGMAIGDGVLSLTDRPADFFPEALPDHPDPALHDITLRHLLMMSSGFFRALLMSDTRYQPDAPTDYAKHVFSHELRKAPGSQFCYSNGDSYLAGRMVEARVGMTLLDYLDGRLFQPLAIPRPEWEACPQGHTFGASCLMLRIEDMAKLGRLTLQNGRWQKQQLVDPAWIREATTFQIATDDAPGNPWHIGYGYQFWLSPYPHAYRADGMYGQITSVLPAANAVISIQCAASDRFDAIQAALDEECLRHL